MVNLGNPALQLKLPQGMAPLPPTQQFPCPVGLRCTQDTHKGCGERAFCLGRRLRRLSAVSVFCTKACSFTHTRTGLATGSPGIALHAPSPDFLAA